MDFVINFFIINRIYILSRENFYEFFTLIEFALIASFFYTQITGLVLKKIILYTGFVYAVFYIVFALLNHEPGQLDSVPVAIETILILLFAFGYLYEQLNTTTTLFLHNSPSFWILLGIVLYLTGSFFIYIFSNYLSAEENGKFWMVTNILSIIKNILFCIAIIMHAKSSKDSYKYDFDLSRLH